MNEWKQAFSLVKFEFKISIVNIMACWLIMTFFVIIILADLSGYVESNYVGFDIFFVLGVSFIPFLFRSKHYQYQKCADELYASPTFMMMTQLPIPKKALIKSRLMITFVYLLPFIVTTFPIIYFLTPGVSEVMSLPTYIAFYFIWFSVIFIIGMMLPASDPGDRVTSLKVTIYFVITFLILFIAQRFFYQMLGYGVVAWLILLAEDFGWIAAVISSLLVVISWYFWNHHMQRKAKQLDYM